MQNSNDLVTVVIPTYNRADYLQEAIKSVLSQSYENFELLIMDNCSSDHTQEIIKSYSDQRIRYIRHHCNIGAMANWTYGVKLAQGKYLSILGDDDRYQEHFLSNRIKFLSQNQENIAVFSPYFHINEQGKTIGSSRACSEEKTLKGRELLRFMSEHTWFIGATLYVTETVKSLWDIIISRCGIYGDSGLNFLIATKCQGQVKYFPEKDCYYRLHDGQDSSLNKIDMLMDGILANQLVLSRDYCKWGKDYFHETIADICNNIGRILWDKENFTLSLYYFSKELAIRPLRLKTWLRYIRCFLYIYTGKKHSR